MTSPFDSADFNRTLFFPRPDPSPPPEGAEDHLVSVPGGDEVHVRIHRHEPADLSLLFFHGNGEIAADYDELAGVWRRLGVELVAAEFRGYGKSTGFPALRAVLEDARVVLDHLRSGGRLRSKLVVMGRSLGSAPAIELAATGADGLIVESGFADPLGLLRRRGIVLDRLEEEDDRRFNNARKIARATCPTLVMHGAEDDLLFPEEGVALHGAAGSPEKRLVLLPGVGHNDILWGAFEAYFEEIAAFLATLRGRPDAQ